MFAIKRKASRYAAIAEQRRAEEQQRLAAVARVASQHAAEEPVHAKRPETVYLQSEIIEEAPAPNAAVSPEKLYLESEIISEEPTPVPAEPSQKVYFESEIISDEPKLELLEEVKTTADIKPSEAYETIEPMEILGGNATFSKIAADKDVRPEDNAEKSAKTAKLSKLPSLIDLMLTMNLSKSVRMNIAAMLLKQYEKYKNAPEEKAIIVECLKRLIASLSKG